MNSATANERLTARMEEIRARHGEAVSLDDVAEVVESLMTTAEGDLVFTNSMLLNELQDLVGFIQSTRAEIANLDPNRIRDEQIAPATVELDAVVQATEQATTVFLDSAERLTLISEKVEDQGVIDELNDITVGIYEASNFQDITGQRITKVLSALAHIENKLSKLAELTGSEGEQIEEGPHDDSDDRHLLNGPSLPDAANSQDDIDAILASFD